MQQQRPTKEIDALWPDHKELRLYIAYLEGVAAAVKWQPQAKESKKKKAPSRPEFAFQCGACKYARKIPAPEGSDKLFIVMCDEPTYGKGQHMIQQARQLGPCGPEAKLRTPIE